MGDTQLILFLPHSQLYYLLGLKMLKRVAIKMLYYWVVEMLYLLIMIMMGTNQFPRRFITRKIWIWSLEALWASWGGDLSETALFLNLLRWFWRTIDRRALYSEGDGVNYSLLIIWGKIIIIIIGIINIGAALIDNLIYFMESISIWGGGGTR